MIIQHKRSIARVSLALAILGSGLSEPWNLLAQAPAPAKGVKYAQISEADLKEWLTYLSSDALQGRQTYSEGYGLASAYIAERLRTWGVKPLGDDGTYFEPVKVRGYRVTRNSSVTLSAGGQSKTFKHGDHVTFGVSSGGKQTLSFDGAEFVGYGLAGDLKGRDLKGKLVVAVPNLAPATGGGGRGRGGAAGTAINTFGAKAVIVLAPAPAPPHRPNRRSPRRRRPFRKRQRPSSRRRPSCRAGAPHSAVADSVGAAARSRRQT